MKVSRINPSTFVIRNKDFTQYYIKGKMLQINPDGSKVLVNTHTMKTIKKVGKHGEQNWKI